MNLLKRAQQFLPTGGIFGDGIHIFDKSLNIIDHILDNDEPILILLKASTKRETKSTRGRKGLAFNRLVRLAILKHLKNWSFRQVIRESQRNLDYRAFTQVFGEDLCHHSVLSRQMKLLGPDTIRDLNEWLCQFAFEKRIIFGKRYRQDSTAAEDNIHYPTDSSLLQDGARVLSRLVHQAQELLPGLERMRNRSRSIKHRVLEIHRSTRSRGEKAKKAREKSYRKLLKSIRATVTHTSRVADKLADGRVTRRLDLIDEKIIMRIKGEMDTMLPRVEMVIRQTRARICRVNNNYPHKLLSLFVPAACVIRKGKLHKPNEFGRLVDLVEVENGFISDYQVLTGNPHDGEQLIPAIERHKERFGRVPDLVAVDRGYWSIKNYRKLEELGVKQPCMPACGVLSVLRLGIQRQSWFRKGQRWRNGIEGRIGSLKENFGLERCEYKGEDAMERWVGLCVLASNLMVVAKALAKMEADGEGSAEEQRYCCREAA